MEIKTTDDLCNAYPALVKEIEEAAAQNATNAERQRIQDIEEMSLPGSETMANEAKFTKPMSAEDYAKAAIRNAKKLGSEYLAGAAKDAKDSGIPGVEAKDGAETDGEKPDEFMDAIKSVNKKQ